MYDPLAVANYFLEIADRESDQTVSNLKMQKLIYFAHGWHLAITGKPLVRGGVQAWRYGPVQPLVYEAFKHFGNERIAREAAVPIQSSSGKIAIDVPRLPDDAGAKFAKRLIERIWQVYGGYTALQLSNLCHRDGTPWKDIEMEHRGQIPSHCIIPDDKIREHFQSQIQDAA
ncbi:MAG: SocA family protein [Candidatus Hydrogenedentes bacterium]|nr:SocA family protein [Candidatus Hydrogenedentota bacterium]